MNLRMRILFKTTGAGGQDGPDNPDWAPEPVAQVRVLPGVLRVLPVQIFWALCRMGLETWQSALAIGIAQSDSRPRGASVPEPCSSENHRPGACMPSPAKTATDKSGTHSTFHGTKKEASIALAGFVTEITEERSTSLPTEAITVSETLTKWLNWRKAQLTAAHVPLLIHQAHEWHAAAISFDQWPPAMCVGAPSQ
jgi:hypothetical protein